MIKLAMLLISSIIGAGFSTGAELTAAFGAADISPFLVASLVGVAVFVLNWATYFLCRIGFRPPNVFFVPIYFIFFIGMTAGMAHLITPFGAVLSLVVCCIVVVTGYEKLSSFNKYIVSFAVLTLVCLGIYYTPTVVGSGDAIVRDISRPLWFSIMIYAGLNCLIFPIVDTARQTMSAPRMFASFALSSFVLAFLVWILLPIASAYHMFSMPNLVAGQNIGTGMHVLVFATIIVSIFSSQFIALFNIENSLPKWSLSKSINAKEKTGGLARLIVYCIIAVGLSSFGFSAIVSNVYPIVGLFIVTFLLGSCVWCYFSRRRLPRQNLA